MEFSVPRGDDPMKKIAFAAMAAAALLSTAACQNMMGEHPQAAAQAGAATQTAALSPEMVRAIQTSLTQKGYGVGAVDGIWGQSTQAALERFQKDQRLNATGQVDERTLASLGVIGQPASTQYTPTSRRQGAMIQQHQTQRMSSAMVKDIQTQLSGHGYDVGAIDGVWGSRTRQALMSFQRDQNMQATGRIDRKTMAALRSGTQTGQMPEQKPAPQAAPAGEGQ
jgi:peptidoglycan hydrolase-like protein with peptidoglycan-binding domain